MFDLASLRKSEQIQNDFVHKALVSHQARRERDAVGSRDTNASDIFTCKSLNKGGKFIMFCLKRSNCEETMGRLKNAVGALRLHHFIFLPRHSHLWAEPAANRTLPTCLRSFQHGNRSFPPPGVSRPGEESLQQPWKRASLPAAFGLFFTSSNSLQENKHLQFSNFNFFFLIFNEE